MTRRKMPHARFGKPSRTWLIGSGVVLGVLVLAGSAKTLSPSSPTSRDFDALASMLVSETSFSAAKNEMAQIVFVAVNRADRWGVPIHLVVAGPRPKAGTNPWNDSSLYRSLYSSARSKDPARWQAARAFAQQVVGGSYRNLGATSFIHPGGMPVPPCAGNRIAASTVAGTRCIPTWITAGKTVGKAMFA